MTRRLEGLTADVAAAGLLAACRLYGVKLERLGTPKVNGFEKARVCTARAAIAGMVRTGPRDGATAAAARIFGLEMCRLGPAWGRKAGITGPQIRDVQDAMVAAGLNIAALRMVGAPTPRNDAAPARKAQAKSAAPTQPVELSPSQEPASSSWQKRAAEIEAARDRANRRRAALRPRPRQQRREEEPVRRQHDVDYGQGVAKPLELGEGDARLVQQCLAHGGFPRAERLGGYTVWTGPDGAWSYRP